MNNIRTIFVNGTIKGAIWGLVLSFVYLLYLVAIFFAIEPIFAMFVAISAFMIGVLPATILGAISGTAIATLYQILKPKDPRQATVLGASVPTFLILLLVFPLIVLAGLQEQQSEEIFYELFGLLLWFGIPLIVFVLCGAYITRNYFQRTTPSSASVPKAPGKLVLVLPFAPPLLILALSSLFRAIPVLTEAEKTLTIDVNWQISDTNRCPAYVDLEFAEAQGYGISTCSESLAVFLEASKNPIAVLTLIEKREFASWTYTVVSVGEWISSDEEWDGVWLECSSTEPECGKKPYPIKDPFKIVSNDQNNQ